MSSCSHACGGEVTDELVPAVYGQRGYAAQSGPTYIPWHGSPIASETMRLREWEHGPVSMRSIYLKLGRQLSLGPGSLRAAGLGSQVVRRPGRALRCAR